MLMLRDCSQRLREGSLDSRTTANGTFSVDSRNFASRYDMSRRVGVTRIERRSAAVGDFENILRSVRVRVHWSTSKLHLTLNSDHRLM